MLSDHEIQGFRDRLVEAATRLIADRGYAALTLRSLARELGCSPTTPYRYFRDRDEIFAAVRAAAYREFAEAQEAAIRPGQTPLERLVALGRAYLEFAVQRPNAYRLQFQLSQPDVDAYPELRECELRAWQPLASAVAWAVEEGTLAGEPLVLAHIFWCAAHGLVTLHLAGKLVFGPSLEELQGPLLEVLLRGSGSTSHASRPTQGASP